MSAAICCFGRTCPKCRNTTRFADDFRDWIEGKFERRAPKSQSQTAPAPSRKRERSG